MDNAERGRGRGHGQAPRGQDRPRVVREVGIGLISLEFRRGDDIVSGINTFAQERGHISMDIYNTSGTVSQFSIQDRTMTSTYYVGSYGILSIRGPWLNLLNGGDRFMVTVVLRDLNNDTEISGRSTSLIAASSLTVIVENVALQD